MSTHAAFHDDPSNDTDGISRQGDLNKRRGGMHERLEIKWFSLTLLFRGDTHIYEGPQKVRRPQEASPPFLEQSEGEPPKDGDAPMPPPTFHLKAMKEG